MAEMVKLMQRENELICELYDRLREAEACRFIEFCAVIKIQSWFRGIRVRNHFTCMRACVIKIQKRWRGVLARKYYRCLLKEAVLQMQFCYYTSMAIKIQKTWRGHHSRNSVIDFGCRKKYFHDLELKNQQTRCALAQHYEQQVLERNCREEARERKKIDDYARKSHFLISTAVIPGIYNSPYLLVPNEMEQRLREARTERSKEVKTCNGTGEKNSLDAAWRRYDAPVLCPLPPVGPKPQGPFREPCEVQWQRYRPFNPTLRVESNYFSVEEAREQWKADEWVARIQDKMFLPSQRIPDEPYQPLSWTASVFGHPAYGTKHFREEFPCLWTSTCKNFKTILPPIHSFDKFNKTYSRGEV